MRHSEALTGGHGLSLITYKNNATKLRSSRIYRSPFTLLYFTGSINGYRRRNYNTIGFRGEEERPKNLGSLVSFMVPKGRGVGRKKKEKRKRD